MPTLFTDPASGFDSAALNPGEIDRVRQIVQTQALSTITTLCAALSGPQNQAMRYDLDGYFNSIGRGTVRMKGGRDGVDFSQPRDRSDIRNDVCARLNLPGFGSSGIFRINVAGSDTLGNQGSEY